MVFFSFYSEHTPYEFEVKQLEATLKRYELQYRIYSFKNKGNWLKNCAMKYTFMRDMLETYRCPVCVLDSDARVLQYPKLLMETSAPIMAHYLKRPRFLPELLDGTLAMTPSMLPVVDEVIKRCEERPDKFDQMHLQEILAERNIPVYQLPVEYCMIQGLEEELNVKPENIVIHHLQASRRNRDDINAGKYA